VASTWRRRELTIVHVALADTSLASRDALHEQAVAASPALQAASGDADADRAISAARSAL
jgi:hypothetical protein